MRNTMILCRIGLTTLLVAFVLPGCQNTASSGLDGATSQDLSAGPDGGTATDAAGGGTDGASLKNSGDCDSDAQCAPGKCVELSPGGFRVCTSPVVEATLCEQGRPLDQCCKSSDCTMGKCYLSPVVPMCAGVMPVPHNECAIDSCQVAADCPSKDQVCVAAGALGRKVRSCMIANCHLDRECSAMPGGTCAPVEDACCHNVIGLYCVYRGQGCRTNADCGKGNHCAVQGNRSLCAAGQPICPL